ncbi:hypothetical protein PSACC_00690 [Paramicrosporidium saccamoebae]|uniref:Uncharacterized protein n=1 Tax=Paramicrosporidium saccamoebae TaxID=1246581 RepID=A0A2H9TP12_9FUNG|nr:hypothetical protein PSACC_00690 [Paramicrosporidium saccamoebae]
MHLSTLLFSVVAVFAAHAYAEEAASSPDAPNMEELLKALQREEVVKSAVKDSQSAEDSYSGTGSGTGSFDFSQWGDGSEWYSDSEEL